MKNAAFITITLALLLQSGFLSPVQDAKTYYVDAAYGNDSRNGLSPENAWKSLSRISDHSFEPGDLILLKRGDIWRETLHLHHISGSPEAPITIAAYGSGEKPQINGAAIASGWDLRIGAVYAKAFANLPKVVVEDQKLLTYQRWKTSVSLTFAEASAGSWSCDEATNTAYVWCSDSADPDTHTMEVAARQRDRVNEHGLRIENASHIVVKDIAIINTTHTGIRVRPKTGYDMKHIILKRLLVKNTGYSGIEISNYHNRYSSGHPIQRVIIEDCVIHDTSYHGIALSYDTVEAKVRYNTVYRNGLRRWGSHGITSWTNVPGAYVRNCTIRGNTVYHVMASYGGVEGAGIQADDHTTNCIYRDNICYDNAGSGLYDNGRSGNKWFYNISFRNGKDSHKYEGGITLADPADCKVYNNVFYDNIPTGIGIYGEKVRGASIKNNICAENKSFEIRVAVYASRGIVSDHNCVYHPAGGSFMQWEGTVYNWPEWKRYTNQDSQSLLRDPLFIDPPLLDFRVQDDSACVDAGEDVGLNMDIESNEVPLGHAVDIGAYERSEPQGQTSKE
jgi:hypothetical protein